jgi:hypothetical protein
VDEGDGQNGRFVDPIPESKTPHPRAVFRQAPSRLPGAVDALPPKLPHDLLMRDHPALDCGTQPFLDRPQYVDVIEHVYEAAVFGQAI